MCANSKYYSLYIVVIYVVVANDSESIKPHKFSSQKPT